MKTKTTNFFKVILLIFISAGLISCEDDNILDVNVSSSMENEITVPITDSDGTFDKTIMFDLSNNEDVEPYLDRIESVDISSATYLLKDYTGTETVNGTVTVDAASEIFGPFQHTLDPDAQNSGEYDLDPSKLNVVSSSIDDDNRLTVKFTGEIDPAVNASFVIYFRMNFTITARAL